MIFLSAPLFGSKHAIGVLAVIILCVIASLFVFNKKKSVNHHRSILIFMVMFYILEIVKLTYITHSDGSFPIYQLPFHLCSFPLYLYPMMYFLKPGAFVERFVKPAAYSVVMLAGIMALALPTNILGESVSWLPLKDNFLPILSFIYHGLMIFSSVYLLRTGIYTVMKNDWYRAILVSFGFAAIAMTVNQLLDKDFMLLHYGNGSPLQFINDYSHFLYVVSMLGLAVILIILNFTITHLIQTHTNRQKNNNVYAD